VLIYCLQRAIWLAERLNLSGCRLPRPFAAALRGGPRALWDPQQGFYVSGAQRQVSWASQIWLVLAEVGTPGSVGRSCATCETSARHRHEYPLPAPSLYRRPAAVRAARRGNCEIKAYWGAMVDYGADTFWEIFDPAHPDFSPYGSKLINSYCHAWSCTPAWFIRQYGL
jgi:hypothetical protein